jgi:hypothetical protein
MDPTDPVWQQTFSSSDIGNSPPPDEGSDSPSAGFVDFALTDPVDSPPIREERKSTRQVLWLLLLPFLFTFFLTCLFLAMRGVMDEGGFVASGGPYEIAHPAPSWVWIFPVAIIACVLLVFASFGGMFMGRGTKASLVALLFWPAIFLSLGWNFFEYGFFKTGGLQWGWIVCAVVFIIMGGLPLYLVVRSSKGRGLREKIMSNAGSLWPQLLGIAAGIPLGIFFFSAIS